MHCEVSGPSERTTQNLTVSLLKIKTFPTTTKIYVIHGGSPPLQAFLHLISKMLSLPSVTHYSYCEPLRLHRILSAFTKTQVQTKNKMEHAVHLYKACNIR